MSRLPFSLRPFTRVVWISSEARERWEPTIRTVSAEVHRLEVESVAAGLRDCAWTTMSEATFPDWSASLLRRGLLAIAVKRSRSFDGFAHRFESPVRGEPASVSAIVARTQGKAALFLEAFRRGDHEEQGKYLGFPSCCRSFFSSRWADGDNDPVYAAAMNTKATRLSAPSALESSAHPLSNPVLRYLGLRGGFHIPHSFDCPDTIATAEERLKLADPAIAARLVALLSMPMVWDSLHGIVVVKTPIFYLVTSTTPKVENERVSLAGDFAPIDPVPAFFSRLLKR